jgi:hypothetical protein
LNCNVDGIAEFQSAMAQALAQSLALEQFGDDVGRTVLLTDVEDGKNVGMVERRGRGASMTSRTPNDWCGGSSPTS